MNAAKTPVPFDGSPITDNTIEKRSRYLMNHRPRTDANNVELGCLLTIYSIRKRRAASTLETRI